MVRQQHVGGIAGQRENMRGNVRGGDENPPQLSSRATTSTPRAQPPLLSTNQRRESWGRAVIGGEGEGLVWRHYTPARWL